eukprot:CAMPEP_0194219076 /NCGR_PEP_ID=MMETSP0156-20130528/25156_1 /TAXON_ID=33649 /ORGANISM="Thalassionema nitzschioides, Strain L26-B" /LENGTH=324 /DNA_ID=CAMNT_0038948625 /DNA_START=105 /DNA_END=1079 /DNA_ORIENTATION=+
MCQRTVTNQRSSSKMFDQYNDEKNIPALARFTLALDSWSPKITLFNLDFGFSLLAMAFFAAMRLVVKHVLTVHLEWPIDSEKTNFSIACLVGGIFHTPFLLSVLGMLLTSQPFRPSASFADYPRWWQDTCHLALQLCTGYMVYDFFVIMWDRYFENNGTIILNDDDPLYIAHHFMTMFYMISVRVVGAGQGSALICMFLGEITNPFFNAYLVLEQAVLVDWCCKASQWFTTLNSIIEFSTAASYALVRGVISPFVLGFYTCGDLVLRNQGKLPLVLRLLFSLLIWAVLLGSKGWVEKFHLEVLPPYYNQIASFFASGVTTAGEL